MNWLQRMSQIPQSPQGQVATLLMKLVQNRVDLQFVIDTLQADPQSAYEACSRIPVLATVDPMYGSVLEQLSQAICMASQETLPGTQDDMLQQDMSQQNAPETIE